MINKSLFRRNINTRPTTTNDDDDDDTHNNDDDWFDELKQK